MYEGIVVGYNTVNLDDPLLDNRAYFVAPFHNFHPVKVIIDKDGKLLDNRSIFKKGKNIIVSSKSDYKNPSPDTTEVLTVPLDSWNWRFIFSLLWQYGLHSLLIEGGPTLQKSIIKEAWWDEAHVLSSNIPMGGGIRAVNLVGKLVESLSLSDNNYHHFIPYEE